MENKVIVRNCNKVSDYFHLDISIEDLLERREEKIVEFTNKYKDLLFDAGYDKFKDFTRSTGMFFLRVYHKKGDLLNVYLDELGIWANDKNDLKLFVDETYPCKQHLTVHIYVDDFYEEDGLIYAVIGNEKKLIYKRNKEYEQSLVKKSLLRGVVYDDKLSLPEKIKQIYQILPDDFLLKLDVSKVKQLECISPFFDFFLLLDNGILFVNNQFYNNGVKEIFCLTTYRCYIIYMNGDIEEYTSIYWGGWSTICNNKKVICGKSFIAYLRDDKHLSVVILPSKYTICDIDFENTIQLDFYNIDDFSFDDSCEDDEKLVLKSNDTEILFPTEIFVSK